MRGRLGRVERKNSGQLAAAAGDASPYGRQQFRYRATWDPDAVRDDLWADVVEHLGDPQGILVVDETGFLKQVAKSAGVARQYSGPAGRIENCQVGVFLAYAAPRGCTFLDRARYLPEEWPGDSARCRAAGIPGEATATTKRRDLAQAMLARAFAAGVPAAWVADDTVYGGDAPAAPALADALPVEAWACASAGEGAQGPRWYDWACLALPYESAPRWAHWLLVRRSRSDPTERAYYRVHAPVDTPPGAMVRAVGRHWAIEAAFAEAKGLARLDQYEVRRWEGWYRHITLSLLAHAELVAARAAATAAGKGRGRSDRADRAGGASPAARRLPALVALAAATPGGSPAQPHRSTSGRLPVSATWACTRRGAWHAAPHRGGLGPTRALPDRAAAPGQAALGASAAARWHPVADAHRRRDGTWATILAALLLPAESG